MPLPHNTITIASARLIVTLHHLHCCCLLLRPVDCCHCCHFLTCYQFPVVVATTTHCTMETVAAWCCCNCVEWDMWWLIAAFVSIIVSIIIFPLSAVADTVPLPHNTIAITSACLIDCGIASPLLLLLAIKACWRLPLFAIFNLSPVSCSGCYQMLGAWQKVLIQPLPLDAVVVTLSIDWPWQLFLNLLQCDTIVTALMCACQILSLLLSMQCCCVVAIFTAMLLLQLSLWHCCKLLSLGTVMMLFVLPDLLLDCSDNCHCHCHWGATSSMHRHCIYAKCSKQQNLTGRQLHKMHILKGCSRSICLAIQYLLVEGHWYLGPRAYNIKDKEWPGTENIKVIWDRKLSLFVPICPQFVERIGDRIGTNDPFKYLGTHLFHQ